MLHFWGQPDEAYLEDDSEGGPEANCTAKFVYRNARSNFRGIARYSKTATLPRGMVIDTERGYVLIRDDDAELRLLPHTGTQIEHVIRTLPSRASSKSVFQDQLEDFIAACRGHRLPSVGGRQALESLRLIEQLYFNRRFVAADYYPSSKGQKER
jgi:predicted dehydrogenase